MASRPTTRAKNKDQHPGTSHTRYDTKRRTAAQIATDTVAEAEARLEAIHASAEKQRLQEQEVAKCEAAMRKRAEQRKTTATRPDLTTAISSSQASHVKPKIKIPAPRKVKPQVVATAVDHDIGQSEDSDDPASLMLLDGDTQDDNGFIDHHEGSVYSLPPMSVSAMDSDSAPPTLYHGDGDDSDDDRLYQPSMRHESDEESEGDSSKQKAGYVRPSVEDSTITFEARPRTSAITAEKREWRAPKARENAKKRKANNEQREGVQDADEAGTGFNDTARPSPPQPAPKNLGNKGLKRSKIVSALGGLKAGWKTFKTGAKSNGDRTPLLTQQSDVTPFNPTHSSDPDSSLAPALDGSEQISSQARTTGQMGIVVGSLISTSAVPLTKKKSSAMFADPIIDRPSRPRTKAKSYTKYDLPFPRAQATKLVAKWSKVFLPCLYDWVGTQDNPWQTNSDPAFSTKVRETWILVFPDLKHEVEHPAIEYIASAGIRSWRSKIGSNASAVVTSMFKGKSPEEVKETLGGYMPAPRFLWNIPDAMLATTLGGTAARLVVGNFLEIIRYHVQYFLKAEAEPAGYPIGAAALTAAAIERGLKAWMSGSQEDSALGVFNQQDWGSITRRYSMSASQLTASKWDAVIKASMAFISANKVSSLMNQEEQDAGQFQHDERTLVID